MAVKKSLGMEVKQKATPNMSSLSATDKKGKAGRKSKRPRPGDFDYTLRLGSVTTQDITRKPVTPLTVTEDTPIKTMTPHTVTADTPRKPVTPHTVTADTPKKP